MAAGSSNVNSDEDRKKSIRKLIMSAVVLVIAIVILLLFLFRCSSDTGVEEGTKYTVAEDEVDEWEQNKKDIAEDYVFVPSYQTLYISEGSPTIYLYNPEENTVYFQYELSDADGEVLYFNEALVSPGRAIPVDGYEVFSEPGTYEVTCHIYTYDIDTQEPCNGCSMDITIVVD